MFVLNVMVGGRSYTPFRNKIGTLVVEIPVSDIVDSYEIDAPRPAPNERRQEISQAKAPEAVKAQAPTSEIESPTVIEEAVTGGEPEASPTQPLTKSDLLRPWGKSGRRGQRSAIQKAEDAIWEAAGSPATQEALDAHGKLYRTNPDGTAALETGVAEADAAGDEFTRTAETEVPADDEFSVTPAQKGDPEIPVEVFSAVEVSGILKPLANSGMSRAAIFAFIEQNQPKLKPLARLPSDSLIPRIARALDALKVA